MAKIEMSLTPFEPVYAVLNSLIGLYIASRYGRIIRPNSIDGVPMKKSILAFVVAAFCSQASAGTVTADHYTITYDDTFWGVATGTDVGWKPNKDTLTFSGLGLVANAKVGRFGASDSSNQNWWGYDVVTITANSGFKIASITTGAKGSVTAESDGGGGKEATASVSMSGYWGTTPFDTWAYANAVSSNQGQYKTLVTTNFGAESAGESPSLAYSLSESAGSPADYYVQSATLSYFYGYLGASANGSGSKSKATLNALSFSVDVVQAVPEPESYAMFLAGLGIIGAVARRRSMERDR